MQPFERIGEKWVAYGLGNLVARHDEPKGTTEEGDAARFTFREGPEGADGPDSRWTVSRAEYLPTLIDLGPPIRIGLLPAVPADARGQEAVRRTDDVVGSLGAPVRGVAGPRRTRSAFGVVGSCARLRSTANS